MELCDVQVHPIENDFIIHWDKKLGTGVNGPVRLDINHRFFQ